MRHRVGSVIGVPVAAMLLATSQAAPAEDLQAAASDFYVYSLPLLEVARRRDAFLRTHPASSFLHARTLADENAREVTTPNNDTIYSNAFIDLRNGAVTISVSATGRRYFSLALMDAYSNNFAYFGTRATDGRARRVTLVGPGGKAPAGAAHLVRSPTPWVWALARTLVTAPDDLPAARAVQDQVAITGAAPGPAPAPTPPRTAPAAELLNAAQRLLRENPPPPADAPILARFRAAGLLSAFDGSSGRGEALAAGFAAAREASQRARRPGEVVNGWIYPKADLGNFGTDYAYRAAVAVTGLAAMGPMEAMYLRSAPDTPNGLFDGARSYRLHFDRDNGPPVDAFWSLSMYERTADGGFYFVANPINRYAFGDRTPGLRRNPDGSLDIWISHADPGPERRSNWLPAPAGPFALSLRAYLPRAELRDGRWRAPAVEPVAR